MKLFTFADIQPHGSIPGAGYIIADVKDLVCSPLYWQRRGLSETASGYGAKLTTRYMIIMNNRLYRVYATCYGNAASTWFTVKGKRVYIR